MGINGVLLGITCIFLSVAINVQAKGAGTTGGEFLNIGVGERAVSMGGAFSSIADNVTAIYWNPAGLTQLKMREFSVMHLNYLVDIKSEYLSYAQPLGKYGAIGSQLALLISEHSRRDDFGNEIGDFHNNVGVFSLAYGYPVKRNLSLGITLKGFYSKLDSDETSDLVFDLGGLYKTPLEGVNLGFVIQNLGTGLKFTPDKEVISHNFKAGISYSLDRSLDNGQQTANIDRKNNLILSADINSLFSQKSRLSAGSEYSFLVPWPKSLTASIRVGYKSGMSSTLGEITGFSTGLGLQHKKMALDYAFVPFGDLCNTHRVSFTIKQ
ncbi:MAG: PorV/PorQ family protein [bacterium]|nr:PorV/PorQ family protein [bacterium]